MRSLLADSDFFQFVAMVIILTIVAIFSWVRKTIERVQRQQKGSGQAVDVGKAVREQLTKYMRAAGQLPPETPPAAPAPPPQAPAPEGRELRPAVREAAKPAVVVKRKGSARRLAVQRIPMAVSRPSRFTPRDVKRAVVQAELLGPPIALRKDYRLF
jgi:hypothetical protein